MGKSTAAKAFRRARIPVFDADLTVHRLQAKGGRAVKAIEAEFPGTTRDGAIDRAALRHATLFANVLNDEQNRELARTCRPVEFARGRNLMTQGDAASSMFIILEGAARVSVFCHENQVPNAPWYM